MTGLVGVIAQETGRYSLFAASITELERPEGSSAYWVIGHDIAENQNKLVEEMYRREAEWLWILGDDHAFSPDALARLLDAERPIVVPLCLQRNPPYRPVIYTAVDGSGGRVVIELQDHPVGGLVEVHSAGGGGMLVRREVLDAVGAPWFELGKSPGSSLGEDLYFCDKARAAGYRVYANLDVPFGHCQTSTIWPVREPDGWTYAFSLTGGMEITLPPSRSWKIASDLAAQG